MFFCWTLFTLVSFFLFHCVFFYKAFIVFSPFCNSTKDAYLILLQLYNENKESQFYSVPFKAINQFSQQLTTNQFIIAVTPFFNLSVHLLSD